MQRGGGQVQHAESIEEIEQAPHISAGEPRGDAGRLWTLDTNAGNLFASRRLAIDIENASGQFVQLRIFNNQEWTFLSEVTFVSAAPVPEPAGLSLLALGGLALMRRRRATA